MPTVGKEIADEIKAKDGYYLDDPRVIRIVEYENKYGTVCYGLEYEGKLGLYRPSNHILKARVYWRAKMSKVFAVGHMYFFDNNMIIEIITAETWQDAVSTHSKYPWITSPDPTTDPEAFKQQCFEADFGMGWVEIPSEALDRGKP